MSWTECTKIYINDQSAIGSPIGIFLNTLNSSDRDNKDKWVTVDVSSLVPNDTKAIHLSGLLVITHGTTPEIADITLSLRTDSSTPGNNYTMQCIEPATTGGQRSTASGWVKLSDSKTFQYKYNTTNPGTYPTYSAYAVNLRIDACAG